MIRIFPSYDAACDFIGRSGLDADPSPVGLGKYVVVMRYTRRIVRWSRTRV